MTKRDVHIGQFFFFSQRGAGFVSSRVVPRHLEPWRRPVGPNVGGITSELRHRPTQARPKQDPADPAHDVALLRRF